MFSRRVVLPALSRPRRRIEYSWWLLVGVMRWDQRECIKGCLIYRRERYTFFTGGIQVNTLGQVIHVEVFNCYMARLGKVRESSQNPCSHDADTREVIVLDDVKQ